MISRMVSVIIPVYQVSDYVERCVRSVMEQTYTDLECVIVDDATKDDSIAKCEALIKLYDGPIRFRIIHHEQNRGLSASRNTGAEAATGDYLFYLDSDDYISPNCIERLISAVHDNPGVEMVQGYYNIIKEGGTKNHLDRLEYPIKTSSIEETRKEFYKNRNIYVSLWNKLLKRSFVEEYCLYCREGLVFEDLLWVFYLMKHLKTVYICKDITYYYCLRQGSISVEAKPESVGCYAIIFDEIFHNLTVGREREEIEGFLYYFIKRYVSYVKIAPALKDTIRLYRAKAKQYHCWYVCVVLFVIDVIGHLGNLSSILECMNKIRWKLKKK